MGGWERGPWDLGSWGGWSTGPGRPGRAGRPGPPPWVAGLFGLAQPEPPRGPQVRRGDVRSAILDVLATATASSDGTEGEPVNGYQVIQLIAERSNGAWRPSPGSVYPTISQLLDEGLVEADDERGRRTLRLTAEGTTYVADHAEELAAVWAPFESRRRAQSSEFAGLKPEIGQVMGAVWQIITTGTDQQRSDAVEILVETRRRLYGLLADAEPESGEGEDAEDPETQDGTGR